MLPVECAELTLTAALLGAVLPYEVLRTLGRAPRALHALVLSVSLTSLLLSLCERYVTYLIMACSIPKLGVAGHSLLRLGWVISWHVAVAGPAGTLRAFLTVKSLTIDLVAGFALAVGGILNTIRWIAGLTPPL